MEQPGDPPMKKKEYCQTRLKTVDRQGLLVKGYPGWTDYDAAC